MTVSLSDGWVVGLVTVWSSVLVLVSEHVSEFVCHEINVNKVNILILRVKGKVYKTVVRPAMMYGAETWAVKKAQEKKLDVAEMRMDEWSHQAGQN